MERSPEAHKQPCLCFPKLSLRFCHLYFLVPWDYHFGSQGKKYGISCCWFCCMCDYGHISGQEIARIQEEKENIRELPSVDQRSRFLSYTNILVSFVPLLFLLSRGRGRTMVGEDGPKELIGMPPPSPKDTPFLFLELKLKTCWNPY